MKLGIESKKALYMAALLVPLGAYSVYTNFLSEPDAPAGAKASQKDARPSTAANGPAAGSAGKTPAQLETERRVQERKKLMGGRSDGTYRPVVKPTREADRLDPSKVDPSLRLDLLAKLQNVTLQGGMRSLFEIGAATPIKGDDPKIPVKPENKLKFPRYEVAMGPQTKPAPPGPAVKPPPPPIPLKFYGYSNPRTGPKRAFFLEGEDIHVGSEGDMIKKRYKIVKIGLNSVVVEDIDFKNQQTLALEEPPAAS